MLDHDFCAFLEYKICAALRESDDDALAGFWCDGVMLPTNERGYLALQYVKHHRKMVFKAFAGKDGQAIYELVLKFGDKALNNYAKNVDLKECVPYREDLNWFDIDTEERRIWIQLD
jgi:hypothetical protein